MKFKPSQDIARKEGKVGEENELRSVTYMYTLLTVNVSIMYGKHVDENKILKMWNK